MASVIDAIEKIIQAIKNLCGNVSIKIVTRKNRVIATLDIVKMFGRFNLILLLQSIRHQ